MGCPAPAAALASPSAPGATRKLLGKGPASQPSPVRAPSAGTPPPCCPTAHQAAHPASARPSALPSPSQSPLAVTAAARPPWLCDQVFGGAIADQGGFQQLLGSRRVDLDGARLLVLAAACALDQ